MNVACLNHFTREYLSLPLEAHLWFKFAGVVDLPFEPPRFARSRSHHHHLQTGQELRPEADPRQPVLRSVWESDQRRRQYVV